MFNYCCSKPQIENVLEKDVDNLRVIIEEMKKQKAITFMNYWKH